MDRIKGMFDDLTGGDDNLDSGDVKDQPGNTGVDDLKARANDLGIGDLNLELLSSLEFPLTKQEVLSQLKGAGADERLVALVEKVPDQVYNTLNELKDKLPF